MLKSTKILLSIIALLLVGSFVVTLFLVSNDSEYFAISSFATILCIPAVFYVFDRDLKIRFGSGLD